MKLLSSKEVVPTIKKVIKGERHINEPFDIEEPGEFKPVNKTRKVQYPMVLRRYQVALGKNKDEVQEWDIDDFRLAMKVIVKKGDNDDIFTKNLTKQSGSTSA